MFSKCNGCELERLKKKWGNRLIKVNGSWYVAGLPPSEGQGEPKHLPNGIPIRFMAWFMSEGHDHSESEAERSLWQSYEDDYRHRFDDMMDDRPDPQE